MTSTLQGVLFDLDGTLLDTAEDLISALFQLSLHHHLPLIEDKNSKKLRAAAGFGCKGLLKIGLGIEETDHRYDRFASELLTFYQCTAHQSTQLFPEMPTVLDFLDKNTIPWGIVTNKPHQFTVQLAMNLHLSHRAKCLISGDTLPQKKPHPAPIIYACEKMGTSPQHCIYLGDSESDVIASKAAGARPIVALYGYIHDHEKPETWGADNYINHPKELIDIILQC